MRLTERTVVYRLFEEHFERYVRGVRGTLEKPYYQHACRGSRRILQK